MNEIRRTNRGMQPAITPQVEFRLHTAGAATQRLPKKVRASPVIHLLASIGLLAIGCHSEERAMKEDVVVQSEKGDAILAKLNTIVIPVVEFENTTVAEAVEFLSLRSLELDPDRDPSRKGVSFIVRQSRAKGDSYLNPNSVPLDHPVSYSARNIRILDLLAEIARQGEVDAYLTSDGIVVTPEGDPPFPNPKAEEGEVWKVIRKAK